MLDAIQLDKPLWGETYIHVGGMVDIPDADDTVRCEVKEIGRTGTGDYWVTAVVNSNPACSIDAMVPLERAVAAIKIRRAGEWRRTLESA